MLHSGDVEIRDGSTNILKKDRSYVILIIVMFYRQTKNNYEQ